MSHPIYKVVEYRIVAPYVLHVRFDDTTTQTINFQPVLAGELYAPLNDLDLFNRVSIDPEVHTLVWPNGETSIPQLCMIGRYMRTHCARGQNVGRWFKLEWSSRICEA